MREVLFDFESEAIDVLPNYPPKPVGLAISVDGRPIGKGYYNAWGHPMENNSDEAKVRLQVLDLIADEDTFWIAHNLAFDAAIIEAKWGLIFPYHRAACTMLLAFMHNPYGELSLKPLCEKLLQMPPTERDAVRAWLVARGICRANDKNWGAFICKAPGDLVGSYAHGDLVRTKALHTYLRAMQDSDTMGVGGGVNRQNGPPPNMKGRVA